MSARVSFVGVLRFGDRVLVAWYSPTEQNDGQVIQQLLSNPNTFLEPRKRYTSEGDMFSIHYIADDNNRVYTAVTDREYPARVAFAMLDEVQVKFETKVGDKSLTAREGGLSRTMRDSFKDICMKYEDVRNVDRLAAVQGKVEVVKTIMEDNIQQLLANQESLERVQENAENLNDQARVFQNRAVQLRRQMRCKAIKMWILLALVIVIVLIIIIVPLAITVKNKTGN